MMRNKKLRTVFCGILIFLLVFALFCLGDYGIRYYHTPIKKDYDYTGTGMLVSLTEPDTFEQVSVEIHGKALHYLWGNQEDAIAGNVWMNGERLFVEGADDMGYMEANCDGCTSGLAEMYQAYIDGKKELRDINMEFHAGYVSGEEVPGRRSCPM